MRSAHKSRVAMVSAGIAAMVMGAFLFSAAAYAEPSRPALSAAAESQGIFVSGDGEVTLKPDTAYVTLGAETQYRTAQEAQRANARILSQVLAKLSGLGISRDDVETTNFSLWPVRTYSKPQGAEVLVGYRVSNQIIITVGEIEKVGPVIDAAVAAGVNNVQSITFTVKDTAKAKRSALKAAALDARNKAEALSEALGLSLSGVIAVSDQTVSVSPPRLMKAATSVADSSGGYGTPVSSGDIKVHATIQVSFAIK